MLESRLRRLPPVKAGTPTSAVFSSTAACDMVTTFRLTPIHAFAHRAAHGAEDKLVELKLDLPPAPKAQGVYKPLVYVGNLVYVSGHGPLQTR